MCWGCLWVSIYLDSFSLENYFEVKISKPFNKRNREVKKNMLNYKKDAKTIIIEMSPDGSKSRGFMSKGMIFLTHFTDQKLWF